MLLGVNMMNRMNGGDPRIATAGNIVDHVKRKLGFKGGLTWGLVDADIVNIIQEEGLMDFSDNFSKWIYWNIDVSEENRSGDIKGTYFLNLPPGQIPLGIEKVIPNYDQPTTYGSIPSGGQRSGGGVMKNATEAKRELNRKSVNISARLHPGGMSSNCITFDPALWIAEYNGSHIQVKMRMAHDLDFSSVDSGYRGFFYKWSCAVVASHIEVNYADRLKGLRTEVGEFDSVRIGIEKWAGQYDILEEKMVRERLIDPNRRKIIRP